MDTTESSDCSTTSSFALTQLLTEMNAESSESDQDRQPQPAFPFQCRCMRDSHQVAGICIQHFVISTDDERQLHNISGNCSYFLHFVVIICWLLIMY